MDRRGIRSESGFASPAAIIAVVALIAAAAGGVFAWQKSSDLQRTQVELANARSEFDKARVDLRKAMQDSAALTKEVTGLKVDLDRLRTDSSSVRSVLETGQSESVRLRAELALAKEQISYLSARSSASVMQGLPRTAKVR